MKENELEKTTTVVEKNEDIVEEVMEITEDETIAEVETDDKLIEDANETVEPEATEPEIEPDEEQKTGGFDVEAIVKKAAEQRKAEEEKSVAIGEESLTPKKSTLSKTERIAANQAKAERKAEKNEAMMRWSMIKSAAKNKTILTGRVTTVEPQSDGVVATVEVEGYRVLIPFNDFFTDSPIDESTITKRKDLITRQAQMLSKCLNLEIMFTIQTVVGNYDGDYGIIGSRKEAMSFIAKHNYKVDKGTGKAIINEGDVYDSSIISIGRHALLANVGGIDVIVPMYRLTYKYISLLSESDEYKIGDKLKVVITQIERDDNGDVLKVEVSAKKIELEAIKERIASGHIKVGTICIGTLTGIHTTKNGQPQINVYLDSLKVPAIAIISRLHQFPKVPALGDQVLFSISKINEERGSVIGQITKVLS